MTKDLVWNGGFAQRECAVEYPSDSDLDLKFRVVTSLGETDHFFPENLHFSES